MVLVSSAFPKFEPLHFKPDEARAGGFYFGYFFIFFFHSISLWVSTCYTIQFSFSFYSLLLLRAQGCAR